MKCMSAKRWAPIARTPFCASMTAVSTAPPRATAACMGAYAHGLFADDLLRASLLRMLGAAPSALRYEDSVDETLEALAAHCGRHIDLDALWEMAR